jgi:hypothetical protein
MRIWNPNAEMATRNRGALTIDGLIATAILGLGAVGIYSLYPVLHRTQQMSKYRVKAVQIGNRMIEHLQLLRPENLTSANLETLNLIQPGQQGFPWRFDRIPMDEASLYSPAQSLPSGQGRLWLTNLPGNSIRAEIEVSWVDRSQRVVHRTGTIIGGYR